MRLMKKTPIGTLVARYKGSESEYPGFWIDLKVGDSLITIATIEYDNLDGKIQTVVYGERYSEEPTDIIKHNLEEDN